MTEPEDETPVQELVWISFEHFWLTLDACVKHCQTIPGMATEPFALLASRTSACRGLAAGHMIHCSMLQWRAPIGHSFSMFFLDHRREISIQFQIFQDMDILCIGFIIDGSHTS